MAKFKVYKRNGHCKPTIHNQALSLTMASHQESGLFSLSSLLRKRDWQRLTKDLQPDLSWIWWTFLCKLVTSWKKCRVWCCRSVTLYEWSSDQLQNRKPSMQQHLAANSASKPEICGSFGSTISKLASFQSKASPKLGPHNAMASFEWLIFLESEGKICHRFWFEDLENGRFLDADQRLQVRNLSNVLLWWAQDFGTRVLRIIADNPTVERNVFSPSLRAISLPPRNQIALLASAASYFSSEVTQVLNWMLRRRRRSHMRLRKCIGLEVEVVMTFSYARLWCMSKCKNPSRSMYNAPKQNRGDRFLSTHSGTWNHSRSMAKWFKAKLWLE